VKLKVDFANPRGCNVYGFRRGMSIDAVKNKSGAIIVKSPKNGVSMTVKNNGGRMFIRSMSGQTLATFSS
jgi:hypothetical protein